MKLGIIIDSSSGMMKEEADKRKWGFLPLFINIDGKEYSDGVDLNPDKYYEIVTLDSDVRTSATPPGLALGTIEKMSKEFDNVVVYALSNKLSSQTNNLTMLAKEFDNVYVVPSHGVGEAIIEDCERLESMASNGASWEEIKEESLALTMALYGVAAPETMKWLVKGGRVGSGTASMANLLKIVPLISYEDGGLGKYGKGRVFKKSIIKFTKDLYEKYGDDREYIIYHSNNSDIDVHKKNIEEVIGRELKLAFFPSVITNHIGVGAVAVITRKKA